MSAALTGPRVAGQSAILLLVDLLFQAVYPVIRQRMPMQELRHAAIF
ncbi:hypothetical protein [Pseudomonas fluorescens]|nr:hypothetical protein [Pseudomonas fluorescens]